jgi:hypothetical protein
LFIGLERATTGSVGAALTVQEAGEDTGPSPEVEASLVAKATTGPIVVIEVAGTAPTKNMSNTIL